MGKVLVCDAIAQDVVDDLARHVEVETSLGLSEEELCSKVGDFDAVVVRSQTKITAKVIEAAKKLQVIARAGVGVDNIDVKAATNKGVMVINSPEGNTISAAEHTLALMLSGARHVASAHQDLAQGQWNRKKYTGSELYGKTLGVVGFGRIGREVLKRCRSFEMEGLVYDPFVTSEVVKGCGAKLCDLDELVRNSDIITLHVPKTPKTENLFDAECLAKMKPGAYLVNCARGGIVDEKALVEAVESGHLSGAAFDVYSQEPATLENPLINKPFITHTPHLAASTQEAQNRVAVDVVSQIVDVLNSGEPPRTAVNVSPIPPDAMAKLKPYLVLMERMGVFLSGIYDGRAKKIKLRYRGELLAAQKIGVLTKTFLKGFLSRSHGEANFVNAHLVAQNMGLEIEESKNEKSRTYASLIEVELATDDKVYTMQGTLLENSEPHLCSINGYQLAVSLEGIKLVTWQMDSPGVVGRVGTVLGDSDINIARMQLGRESTRSNAVMVLGVDNEPSADDLAKIAKVKGIERVCSIVL